VVVRDVIGVSWGCLGGVHAARAAPRCRGEMAGTLPDRHATNTTIW
jgi:hypothetical protein